MPNAGFMRAVSEGPRDLWNGPDFQVISDLYNFINFLVDGGGRELTAKGARDHYYYQNRS